MELLRKCLTSPHTSNTAVGHDIPYHQALEKPLVAAIDRVFAALPAWSQVSRWRSKLVATCDYEVGYMPGNMAWDEGYPVWWQLGNVRLLKEPILCKGNVRIWKLMEFVFKMEFL